jgi:hypothetical protein
MTTLIQPPSNVEEQRVVLSGVSWQQYESLRQDSYPAVNQSQFFPDLDLPLLAQYILPQEQPQAVKEFLKAVRSQKGT